MNLEKNRPHFVAGIYTAYSDVIGKRLGFSDGFLAPYLIHNLDPLKAGIAGCLISFTANKIYDLIIPRLSEHAQKSALAKFYIHTFSCITVGVAFGAGSALLIPAASITATAGIALGISSAVGTFIDGAATVFNTSEYGLKHLPPIAFVPIPGKDLIVTAIVAPFFITFSDTIIKCFVNPQSFLAGLLLHNVQGVMRSFLLSSLISTSGLLISAYLTSRLPAAYANSNLIKFPIWIVSPIIAGAAAGLMATVPSYLALQTKVALSLYLLVSGRIGLLVSGEIGWVILPWALAGSLNLTTGIALGIACVAAYPLTLLIQRITNIFYAKSSLLAFIQGMKNINNDIFTDIKEKGNQLHQAKLFREGLYKQYPAWKKENVENLISYVKDKKIPEFNKEEFNNWKLKNLTFWKGITEGTLLDSLESQKPTDENIAGISYALKNNLIKKDNIQKLISYTKDNFIEEMDKEKFENWRSTNLTFWEGVTEGKTLDSLESQKPTNENIAGICYALKNDLIYGILVFQHLEQTNILVDSTEYPEIHLQLPEELKINQEFNERALVTIGNTHLKVMPLTMRIKELENLENLEELKLEKLKLERLIVQCAHKNPHFIYDIDQKTLKDILPAFVGHSKFGLDDFTKDWEKKWSTVVKLSAKACGVTEKKLLKSALVTFCLMKKLKINNNNIPKPIQKMILFYTLIPNKKHN